MEQARPELLKRADAHIWGRFKRGEINEVQARAELAALDSIFVVISRDDNG